jgi:hypothetical protein
MDYMLRVRRGQVGMMGRYISKRDAEITVRFAYGERQTDLAQAFKLSTGRVSAIIQRVYPGPWKMHGQPVDPAYVAATIRERPYPEGHTPEWYYYHEIDREWTAQ